VRSHVCEVTLAATFDSYPGFLARGIRARPGLPPGSTAAHHRASDSFGR